METPRRQFQRVLLALEDFVAQEESAIRTEDFDAVTVLQSRAAPLVDFLVTTAAAADLALTTRVAALIARRTRNAEELSRQIARVGQELSAMRACRQRIAQVLPAYRQSEDARPVGQLCAQG